MLSQVEQINFQQRENILPYSHALKIVVFITVLSKITPNSRKMHYLHLFGILLIVYKISDAQSETVCIFQLCSLIT